MPVSSVAFVRATAGFLLAGIAALALIIAAALWLVERTQSATDELLSARVFRAGTVDLLGLVQEMESGQRGYLLTGRDSYLAPYERARAAVGPKLAALAADARDAALSANVAQVAAATQAKLAELAQTVDLARAGRRDEAIALVQTDRGKDTMDEARVLIGRLVAQAEARAAERVAEQRTSVTALQWTITLGAALIALVVGGAVWIVMRYTRDLVAARGQVERLNTGLEEHVRERTLDLARANDEIQRYAYIVSHDLRAPLVNVMGYTSEIETSLKSIEAVVRRTAGDDPDLAEARVAVDTDLPEAIGFIRSSTDRMDRLIGAILRLSREGRRVLRPEPVALRALLEAAAASVAHRLSELDGTIAIEGEATIISDRLGLEQVFANLIDNAVKYRQPGRPPVIAARVSREGAHVVVEVEDNGRGIATGDRGRVFELFRRAGAQDQPGEGIGLAHVLALVRRLGGDVALESQPGRGSTFRVTLPHRVGAEGALPAAPVPQAAAAG